MLLYLVAPNHHPSLSFGLEWCDEGSDVPATGFELLERRAHRGLWKLQFTCRLARALSSSLEVAQRLVRGEKDVDPLFLRQVAARLVKLDHCRI